MVALGDVVEEIGHAALRVGIDDDPQRPPVGQIPDLLARLDRLIGGEEALFPAAEIGLFRQQAGGAQLVEDLGIARMLIDEGLIERPELAIGGIMEDQTLAPVEYGDGGRKLVERARMRLHLAIEIGPHRLDLRDVDRHAGRAHGSPAHR